MLDDVTGKMPGAPVEIRCRCGFIGESKKALARHKKDCPVERLIRVPSGAAVRAPASLGHTELTITEPAPAPIVPSAEAQAAEGQEAVGSKALPPDNAAHVAGNGKAGKVLGRGRMLCPSCGAIKASHGACKACGTVQPSRLAMTRLAEPRETSMAWARIRELKAALAVEESKIKNRYKPMACFDATGGNNYSRLD